ncbi:MAG: hypothetical protein [Bacteriophage sp.]|nr:MAG: hypothetical protein [Bacteriophage sp.]
MKKIATYQQIQIWYENASELMEIYQEDDNSLTMDVAWAIIQNYKYLNQSVQVIKNAENQLIDKYGSLQPDGSKKIDQTCTEVVQAYNKEIDELMNQKTKIKIEKIDHRNLNVKMSLETASLFDFMIN